MARLESNQQTHTSFDACRPPTLRLCQTMTWGWCSSPRDCNYCSRLAFRQAPFKDKCQQQELNLRPTDYKSVALPTELCWLKRRGVGICGKTTTAKSHKPNTPNSALRCERGRWNRTTDLRIKYPLLYLAELSP